MAIIVDRTLIMFVFQFLVSLTLIVFCMAMLITGHEVGIYLPILSSTCTYWLPSPNLPNSAEEDALNIKPEPLIVKTDP
jgi:hypothetical protein